MEKDWNERFERAQKKPRLHTAVKAMLIVWCVLLAPWVPMAPWAGMACDAGPTLEANTFVWSAWTYPVSVIIALIFSRKIPFLSLLPFLNVMGTVLSGLQHGPPHLGGIAIQPRV